MKNHHGGVVLVNGYLYGFNDSILTLPGVLDRQADVARPQRRQGRRSPTPTATSTSRAKTTSSVWRRRRQPAYKEKGRFTIADQGLPSWAHPVVSGGRLYVRNQATLAAYDIKAK